MSPVLQRVLERLDGVRREGEGQWVAYCPVHQERTGSLAVSLGARGEVLVSCLGCNAPFVQIAEALNLEPREFYPPDQQKARYVGRDVVATYVYTDAQGKPLFRVVRAAARFDNGATEKRFLQERAEGDGFKGGKGCMRGVRRVLYRLPDVVAAVKDGRRIYLVEGEKDADALAAQGRVATCNPGGAGKWTQAYTEALRGADEVVLLPDNDQAGRDHAELVGAALTPVVNRCRVLELPKLPHKGDVSDWLATGKTAGDLDYLAKLAPLWAPAQPAADSPNPPSPPAPEPKAPRVRGPLDGWEVIAPGELIRWKHVKDGDRVPESMFKGVPRLALVNRVLREDPERPGEWAREEELTYEFDLLGRERPIEVRATGGRDAFVKALAGDVRLDAAANAISHQDRARLHKWAIERSTPGVTQELRAIGHHHAQGWVAPPGLRVRAGRVERLSYSVGPVLDGDVFRRFRLAELDDEAFRDVARWVVSKLLRCDLADQAYTLPLLGAFLAAPLWHYVPSLKGYQRYVFFVQGSSGVGKSQVCRYFWSFWGDFVDQTGLPTWLSSASYLGDQLHDAVGVPFFVSDWKRATLQGEDMRRAMALLQAYADKSARGRWKEKIAPPRCTWVTDGEDLPVGEQSTIGRLLVLQVAAHGEQRRCADANPATLDAGRVAQLPGLTARWIAWVQRNGKALERELSATQQRFGDELDPGEGGTNRSRLVSNYSVQDLTTTAFFRFLEEEAGLPGLAPLGEKAHEIHRDLLTSQAVRVGNESYGDQFLSELAALLRSGDATLEPRRTGSGENPFTGGHPSAPTVGLFDRTDHAAWIDSSTAMRVLKRANVAPATSLSSIEAQLLERGLITKPRINRGGRRFYRWQVSLDELAVDAEGEGEGELFEEAG